MEYKGIEFSVVRKINSSNWQWSVNVPTRKNIKIGSDFSRELAVNRAKALIDDEVKNTSNQTQPTSEKEDG